LGAVIEKLESSPHEALRNQANEARAALEALGA
jgi:hypothetical protein